MYLCMHSIMHCSHCDRVVKSLLTIATNGLWSVITLLPSWSSSGGTSPDNVVCQGPLTLCCYTTTLCWIHSCLQMQWNTMLFYSEPSLINSSCQLLFVKGQSLGQYKISLSPGIGALVHHRIRCMYLAWLCSWLCHIIFYICCSWAVISENVFR